MDSKCHGCPDIGEACEECAKSWMLTFNWDEEYDKQRDAYNSGSDIIESGTCNRCGKSYAKTIGESNISMSGLCLSCGFNP